MPLSHVVFKSALHPGRGRHRAPRPRGGSAGRRRPLPVGGHGAGGRDRLGRGLRHRRLREMAVRRPRRRLPLRRAAAARRSRRASPAGWPIARRSPSSRARSSTRTTPRASSTALPPCPRCTRRRPATRSSRRIGVDAIRRKSMRQVQRLVDLARERGFRRPHAGAARGPRRHGHPRRPHGQAVTRELLRREVIVDFRPGPGSGSPALLHDRRRDRPRPRRDPPHPGFGRLPGPRDGRWDGLLTGRVAASHGVAARPRGQMPHPPWPLCGSVVCR